MTTINIANSKPLLFHLEQGGGYASVPTFSKGVRGFLHTQFSKNILFGFLYLILLLLATLYPLLAQNTWTQKSDFGGIGTAGCVSVTLNGKGYVGIGATTTHNDEWWEYDSDANTWTQKADFAGGERSYCVIFEIDDKAYCGAGQNASNVSLSDFYVYDPLTNTWTATSSMPGLSRGEAYSFSANGKGYVGCGVNRPSLTVLNDFYEYDPDLDSWTQKTNFPGSARASGWSFGINGKGYFGTGGSFTQDVYEYNPTNNTWSAKANYPLGGFTLSGRFVIGNKAYIVGGFNSSVTSVQNVYEFDPILNTWTSKANYLPGEANSFHQFGFSIDNKGYIGAGRFGNGNFRNDFYEYTPGTTPSVNTTIISNITTTTASSGGDVIFDGNYSVTARGVVWSTSANPTIASQPGGGITSNGTGDGTFTSSLTGLTAGTQYYYRAYATNSQGTSYGEQYTFTTTQTGGTWARQTDFFAGRNHAVAFSINGKGYIGTGEDGSVKNDFWEYDPTTFIWTQKANFGGLARRLAVGISIGEYGYIGTGQTGGHSNDWWEYDPVSNSWSQRANFLGGARSRATAFSIGNKGYVGTGDNGSFLNDFYEYDRTTNSWSSISNFAGSAREIAVGFSVNGKGYVGTGQSSGGFQSDFYEYDPNTNNWTQRANFTGAARYVAVGFALNNKGYIGTGVGASNYNNFFEYNPTTNSWTSITSFPGSARYGATAFVIGDLAYVGTGTTNGSSFFSDFYSYKPNSEPTLTTTAISSIATTSASSGGNVTATGGEVVTARGLVWSSTANPPTISNYEGITTNGTGTGAFTQTINALCPGTTYYVRAYATNSIGTAYGELRTFTTTASAGDIWVQKANFGGSARYGAAHFSIGTKGYIGCGQDAGSTKQDFWEYDPASNVWTQKANFAGASRERPAFFSIGTKGYIGLGFNGGYLSDFYEYDPTANTWTSRANFGGSARYSTFHFAIGTKGYVGGGENGSYLQDFWEYDQTGNTWTAKANFGGGNRGFATAIAIGTKGYAGLGYDGILNKNDFWEYDPISNTWTTRTSFPGAIRSNASGFTINNKGYLGLGSGASSYNDLYEYDATQNTWTQKTNFTGVARQMASAFAIGAKGYFGVGYNGSYLQDFFEYTPSTIPQFISGSAGSITQTGATISANYDANFNGCSSSPITDKGLVWNTLTNPTTSTNSGSFSAGAGTGNISNYTITGLQAGTTYYVRAYTTTALGTAYGNEVSFSTIAGPPTLTTTAISSIATTSASSGGNVTSDGGDAVTARGLVWSSTANPPTIASYEGITTNGTGTGSFTQTINALCPGTTYYVRAYATNSIGTAYGELRTFTTTASAGDIWVQKANFGGSARYGEVGFTIGNKGYVGTGGTSGGPVADFWEYDIFTNVWTQKANYSGGAVREAIGFSINNKGYVGLGYDGSLFRSDFWEYDPIANSWISRTSFPSTARVHATSFVSNNLGYVGFGSNGGTIFNNIFEFNPTTNSWTAKTSFPSTPRRLWNTFVVDNIAYLVCGENIVPQKDFWTFNTTTNSWLQKNDFPGSVRYAGYGFSIDNKGYIGGGFDNTSNLSDFWEFDLSNETWLRKSDFIGLNSYLPSIFVYNKKAYLVNGLNSGVYYNLTYEYTPSNIVNYQLSSASNVNQVQADISANFDINFNGCNEVAITQKGFVWDVNPNPTTTTNLGQTTFGAGKSNINHTISELAPSTQYFVRSYSTTSYGTQYSNEITFTTLAPVPPVINNLQNLALGAEEIVINIDFVFNGGLQIIASGVVYSISPNPDINSYIGGDYLPFTFQLDSNIITLRNLQPETTYYLRAFAQNSVGITYSNQISFTTRPISDDVDSDGIADDIEAAAPNNGDGNGDGIPDNLQPDVASFIGTNGAYITLVSLDGLDLLDVRSIYPEDLPKIRYPFGLAAFKIRATNARVQYFYHGMENLNGHFYRKLSSSNKYFTFEKAEFGSETIAGIQVATVILTLQDGGNEDYDGVVNGVIYDPGGPAIFVGALIPTFSEWVRIIALCGFLLVGALWVRKVV